MHSTTVLSTSELWLNLFLIALFVFFLFGVLPGWKRSIEKSAHRIFSFRAIVKMGARYLRKGGIGYRISLYDEFLVIVFFGCEKIKFGDIKTLTYKGDQDLSMIANGVEIKISGFREDLEKLHSMLKERMHS